MVYPALLQLMRTPRLPVVDWTDAPADLNGLVRFAERRNLVSARVPSHFKRSLHHLHCCKLGNLSTCNLCFLCQQQLELYSICFLRISIGLIIVRFVLVSFYVMVEYDQGLQVKSRIMLPEMRPKLEVAVQ